MAEKEAPSPKTKKSEAPGGKGESPKPKKAEKQEAPKTEAPKQEAEKKEEAKPVKESPKVQKSEKKQEAPKQEGAGKTGESPKQKKVEKQEAAKPAPEKKEETPKQEAPKTEAPKSEAAKPSPKKEEAKKPAEKAAPKKEEPKKEKPPKTEQPKKEKPAQKAPPVVKERPKLVLKKREPKKDQPIKVEVPKPVVPAPESYLKKRKRNLELQEKAKRRKVEQTKRNNEKRQLIFKRAEQYVREYRAKERSLIHFRRTAKKAGNFFLEPEPKLALVIRIRGTMGLHPKPRKILQLLRLRQIHNATFVRLTGATKQMLRLIEPYVTYGTPNLKTVRELIYKRGFAKINRQRIPITNNSIIENALGKYGIICVEDLIHEIYTVGPNFKQANRFLWSFKLNPPRGGYKTIKRHFNEGGDFGDREDKINALVQRMN